MNKIEELAIEYIKTRRAKLTAKSNRNNLLNHCEARGEGPLCVNEGSGVEWCEACVKAQPFHKLFKMQSIATQSILKKLERAVNKVNP